MYLGLDLGTSGLRALLIDEEGNAIASEEASYEPQYPRPGYSEQDPQDWILALEKVMGALAKRPEFNAIKAIGVAGHMHGAVLVDAKGQVIRPCILWNDSRASKEAQELDAQAAFRAHTGNIVFAGFTAPKLVWLQRNEPENFARIHKILLPASYLNFYLTGEYFEDCSDASGTSWLNVSKRQWDEGLLKSTGLELENMPRLVEGASRGGALRAELAQRWGLQDVVVAGGAGDNAAAACGMGVLQEGQGFVSLGTSGVILVAREACSASPKSAVHSFCHAVPNRWYQMGVMLAATDSLNWFARLTGKSPAELTSALGSTLRPPSDIRFLPFLSGERTPHNDAEIRGSFTGLDRAHEHEDLTQALLEGVAFALRDNLHALKSTGANPASLYAIGGGAKSEYWLQLIATVLGIPLYVPQAGEFGAAMGAARLAQTATGRGISDVMKPPKIARCVEPNEELKDEFLSAFVRYQLAYPKIKSAQ